MDKPVLAAMLSLSGTKLSDDEKMLLEQFNPLGITLFAKNIESKPQLNNLTNEIRQACGRADVLIAIDQEGGRVRRLREPEFRSYAAQIDLGLLDEKYDFETLIQTIQNHALLISQDLHACGINWNYAPCLDILYPQTSDVLKSRCLSHDEKKVAILGREMIDAYIQSGICPCVKHMPGHGRASVDPHLHLPILKNSLSELKKDFYPFWFNRHAPAGMTAHIVIAEVDDKHPVTQSKIAIDKIIRGEIGFEGFLISDSINMNALQGNVVERAQACFDAGCDAICYCYGNIDEMRSLCLQCPNLSDNSLIRLAKIENIFKNDIKNIDYKKIEKDYAQICGAIEKYDDKYDATETLRLMQIMS